MTINGMEGYTVLTRNGSPLDHGAGPVRWITLYRGGSAFLFAGASRSARDGKPEADGLIRSVAETMRDLRAAEFPLAEPYRLKIVRATRQDAPGRLCPGHPCGEVPQGRARAHQRAVSEQETAGRGIHQDRRVV